MTQINPLISNFIKEQWSAEKESKVKSFLEYNDHAEKLLELLEEDNQDKDFPVDKEVLKSTSHYSEGVRGQDDDRENSTGYWLWFEDYLLEEFEKKLENRMLMKLLFPYRELLTMKSQPNKRMLSDCFSAALQTSRKCGR
ncbi:hypothetical protein [Aliamphritea spongicola]|nr:hypothetical protein [Aliamphritea spongicola]